MNEQLEKYCISGSETILSAIERIEQNNMRSVFVIQDGRVVGVVSQGDILRAIIMGSNLYTQINKIMTTSFIYLRKKDIKEAIRLFKTYYFSLIPVLTDDFKLKDVILFTDLINMLELNENDRSR
ncbi:MAG: CBS domain-containing protein [Nitrospirae bacterium]|nr:CBS domain-containing protein [Nitrospirota bacterium]